VITHRSQKPTVKEERDINEILSLTLNPIVSSLRSEREHTEL
jgi:hypothetical protein